MKRSIVLACSLVAAGCATPPAVFQLAEKTAEGAGQFVVHLNRLEQHYQDIARQRMDLVVRREAGTRQFQADLARYRAINAGGGGQTDQSRWVDSKLQLFSQLETIQREALKDDASRSRDLLGGLVPIKPYSEKLMEIGSALATQGTADSKEQRLRFLAGYLKEVRTDLKSALNEDNALAQSASTLIDSAKADLESASAKLKIEKK